MDLNELIEKYSLPSPPEEAHYTVYKLTDPKGKIYIGCTGKPVEERWKKGKNYNYKTRIFKAISSIGWDNFEKTILCEKLTKAGAEKLEKWFIAYYDSADPEKGYNRALGGLGKGFRMSKECREEFRKRKCLLYEEDPDYRERVSKGILAAYEHDPDYRERVRKGVKAAYEKDPDLRERVGKGIKAAYENDPSYRDRVSEALIHMHENNYELSKKMQDYHRKYNQLHAEKREKHSRWMKEYLSKPENRAFLECSHKAKPVVCVETGVIYPSQCAAEKASGFRGVHKACTGEHHTCGGYHWRYADKGECSSFLG